MCLASFFLSCVASIVALGCSNPFSTRDAETPNLGRSEWFPPTSPSVVLANLRNAVQGKNAENYLRCLADTSTVSRTFVFIPDQSVANNNPGFFDTWNRESEGNYIRQIFSVVPDDSTRALELTTISENSFPDSAVFVQSYFLRFDHTLLEVEYPRTAEGQVEFSMIHNQNTGYWYIHRWVDSGISQVASWSSFKVIFGK